MTNIVSVFQLGSSTVVTLPKKLGFKPGDKLRIEKTGQTIILEESKEIKSGENLLKILEKAREAWADTDWEEYDRKEKERREFELEESERRKKAW